jgi:hypothetical protein
MGSATKHCAGEHSNTKQCSFRLLDVVLSSKFFYRLDEMSAPPVRCKLDARAFGVLNPL